MTRRALVLLICAFALTRGYQAWATSSPLAVSASRDIGLYESWAEGVVDDGLAPYRDIDIEYPPGSLPFVIVPELWGSDYRTGFVGMTMLIDALGLAALLLLARRTGVTTGAWLWIWGLFLLGPITYMRLDMVPAVATLWAIEASSRDAYRTAGAWWGLAVATKLYPVVLLPAVIARSPRPSRVLTAGAVVIGAAALLVVTSLGPMWTDVIGYHGGRGLQLESTWAFILQVAGHMGYGVVLHEASGGVEVASSIAGGLKAIALTASIVAVIIGTAAIVKGSRRHLYAGLYGLLALVLGLGTVLSPQFIVWLVALAAPAACLSGPGFRTPILAVLPIAFATQLVFPTMWTALTSGSVAPLIVLGIRDLALIALGLWTLRKVWSDRATD